MTTINSNSFTGLNSNGGLPLAGLLLCGPPEAAAMFTAYSQPAADRTQPQPDPGQPSGAVPFWTKTVAQVEAITPELPGWSAAATSISQLYERLLPALS